MRTIIGIVFIILALVDVIIVSACLAIAPEEEEG